MSVTSVGIRAREGREMGPMGPGILKTVQSAHGVATIRGARDNAVRSGAPGNEARTSAAAPKPETRAWWGSRPIPPRQPPPLTCREVTSPNRPLSRPRLRLRDRAAQRTQQAQHHSGPYSSEAVTQGRVRCGTQACRAPHLPGPGTAHGFTCWSLQRALSVSSFLTFRFQPPRVLVSCVCVLQK